jgi:hypothetical protein
MYNCPGARHESIWEGADKSARILTSALDACGQIHAPTTLLPRKKPSFLIVHQNRSEQSEERNTSFPYSTSNHDSLSQEIGGLWNCIEKETEVYFDVNPTLIYIIEDI